MLKTLAKRTLSQLPLFKQLMQRLRYIDEVQCYNMQEQIDTLRASLAQVQFENSRAKLDEILTCFHVRKVVGFEKIRVGSTGDGGYVMLDDFASIRRAYSLGIADDVSWDLAMAERGIPVSQFDFSVEGPPVRHRLFTFSQTRVGTIADIGATREPGQILKIDIEGSEWGFFHTASTDELSAFDQIVAEIHDFDRYYDPLWQAQTAGALAKLNRTHQLIHLHGNNHPPFFQAGDLVVPRVFEVTYVLRSKYKFGETDEPFPGPLDQSNVPGKADLPLERLLARAKALGAGATGE